MNVECKHKQIMVYAGNLYICPGCDGLFEVKPSDKISMFDPRVRALLTELPNHEGSRQNG